MDLSELLHIPISVHMIVCMINNTDKKRIKNEKFFIALILVILFCSCSINNQEVFRSVFPNISLTDDYEKMMGLAPSIEDHETEIIEKSIEGGVKGYFDPNDQTIYINSGMSQSQTVKTMIHELAHSILHNKNIQTDEKKDRNKREIEAESVAFIVCKHFNIDTDDYSFGYILGWSKDSSLDEFRDSLETIQKCADKIIGNMQARLLKLEWEKKSLKSRLDEGRKRSALLGNNIKKEKTHERNHTFQH